MAEQPRKIEDESPPVRRVADADFLRRVYGNIKHSSDPKVQRTAREIDRRLSREVER